MKKEKKKNSLLEGTYMNTTDVFDYPFFLEILEYTSPGLICQVVQSTFEVHYCQGMGGGCYRGVHSHGLLLGWGGRTIIGSWASVGRILDFDIWAAFIWVGVWGMLNCIFIKDQAN